MITLAIASPAVAASGPAAGVTIVATAPGLATIPSGGGSSSFTLQLTNESSASTGPLTVAVSRLTGFAGLTDDLVTLSAAGWSVTEESGSFVFTLGAGLSSGESSQVYTGTWVVTKGVQAAYSGVSTAQLVPGTVGEDTVILPFATTGSPDAISLGSAAPYLILARGALTVVGVTSQLTGGLVGVEAETYTNLPQGVQKGTPTENASAKTDVEAAHAEALSAGPAVALPPLAGSTLVPGVYHQSAALGLTGAVEFDAQGDPNAVFIVQTGGAFTTAAGSSTTLVNGASASNIFWVTTGAVTLGAGTTLHGTVLSGAAITVGAGSTIIGRLLTTTADVTFSDSTQRMFA